VRRIYAGRGTVARAQVPLAELSPPWLSWNVIMGLIKMATAARRARMGSANTILRALRSAGVPVVALSPGVFGVQDDDLHRFLQSRRDTTVAAPRPANRPADSGMQKPAGGSVGRQKTRKRRQ
jgi:hypothetical protein